MSERSDQLGQRATIDVQAERSNTLLGAVLVGGSQSTELAALHQAQSAHLPDMELSNRTPSLLTEVGNVLGDVKKGAADEILHHGGELLATAEKGALTGVCVGGLATIATGAGILSARAISIAGLVIGGGYLVKSAVDVFENRDKIMHETAVVANPNEYSVKELKQARLNAENFGASAANEGVALIAGALGGYAGSIGTKAFVSKLTGDEGIADSETEKAIERNYQLAPRATAIFGVAFQPVYANPPEASARPGY